MPRKQRIEYAGAVYHVISRGNYRKDLFTVGNSGKAFEKAIFEVVERCRWELYAYVILSNHYHIAVKTVEPNLVVGMKCTFATRFNRYSGECGHVFQGRYKSILIDEDHSLLGLINYIHLNPVRANLCQVSELKAYELSSYPKYWMRKPRKELNRRRMLSLADLPDSIGGMRRYTALLELSEEGDLKKREELFKRYCRGWYIGSAKSKMKLCKILNKDNAQVEWEGVDLKELNRQRWENIAEREMKRLNKTQTDIVVSSKGTKWKIAIAQHLRNKTTASNPWIAERLNMGHPSRVSNLLNNR